MKYELKKCLSCLIIALVILTNFALPVQAETDKQILFGVWFSRSKVFTEKVVRLYISLTNQSGSDVTGTIELYDNGAFINRREVLIVNGKSNDWWFDQQDQSFVYGEHLIKVHLVKSSIREIGKSAKDIVFKNNVFTKTIFIDRDTDDDDLGDLEDPDDDNDGLSDEEEIVLGLDPKMKNSEPEIKVAREKFRNKNRSSNDSIPLNKTNNPLDKIISRVPSYLADPVKKSDKIISNLSNKLAKDLTEKRKIVLKEIEINKEEREDSKSILDPNRVQTESRFFPKEGLASLLGFDIFKKIYAFILWGLVFILENKIILYPVLLFIIYKLVRLLFRRKDRKPLN